MRRRVAASNLEPLDDGLYRSWLRPTEITTFPRFEISCKGEDRAHGLLANGLWPCLSSPRVAVGVGLSHHHAAGAGAVTIMMADSARGAQESSASGPSILTSSCVFRGVHLQVRGQKVAGRC